MEVYKILSPPYSIPISCYFPDNFEFRAKETTGSLRRRFEVPQYTQVGNAVPPLLAEAVGKHIHTILTHYISGTRISDNLETD